MPSHGECILDGTFLFTIEAVAQVGNDLIIAPLLPADKWCLVGFVTIKVVKPDGQIVEMHADAAQFFSRPPTNDYMIIITDAKEEDVPVGSQIWIK
jgi:hypothetical protein